MAVSEAAGSGAGRAPWGVAALLLATGDALAARFGAVAVRGELSGFMRAASGHCYFSLKDAEGASALLRCAMFRRAASLLDFAPADGQQVELRGRLGVYDARGELQLVVEAMQRVGAGTLYEEFLRRRARLAAEGLFDATRKRAIAAFPQRLGVITSPAGAALHDVLTTLRRRSPQVAVVVYPSLVQGSEAPAALESALRTAARRAECDTLLLVRGGGSLEDLWAFNDERVVRAVAASPIPVVCGVGHETDVSLADLAADLRAPTPTAAAELAAPVASELLAALAARQAALEQALQRCLQVRAQRLDTLALRLGQPGRGLLAQGQRLQGLQWRLQQALGQAHARQAVRASGLALRLRRAMAVQLQQWPLRLSAAQERLRAHDPHRVLQRGYAWVESLPADADAGAGGAGAGPASAHPVVSAAALRPGQRVRAVWADGHALAAVESVHAQPAAREPLPPAA